MRRKSFALSYLLVPLALFLAGSPTAHARIQPVFNTDIDVPCKMGLQKVKKAIRSGLKVQGGSFFGQWLAAEKKPGLIAATLYVRRHVLVLDIIYNTKAVKFRYKNSENLKHRKRGDVDFIHPNANKWIRNIVIGIDRDLSYNC
ncbi:MAG: hypothetical protein O7C67_13585 [Gammaproteobacteria bacterium]|nr:hypothetical protein [Gammaproteobacteria bacterium]